MQYSLNIIFGMTIDLKSLIFEAREMDLSSHMTFSFDSELCALAILERISGLEPLSVTRQEVLYTDEFMVSRRQHTKNFVFE